MNTSSLAGGVVVDDFDGDAILDIVTSSSDPLASLRYFAGRNDGRFRERSRDAGFEGLLGGFNLVQADYDNDGDTDILVLRGAWEKHRGRHPNSLLRNDGGGTFTDVTFESGLGETHYPTQTAAWADYDNDGDLDLYVGNEWFENFPAPSQLFRNDGDGAFTDVAEHAGVQNKRCAKGVTWADFNADRFPDLYVSNCRGRNRLYRNNQNGTFTDVALAAGVDQPWNSLATWAWDYDNDGALDLFVAAYATKYAARLNDDPPDLDDVVASYLGLPHDAESARLYQGNGRGGFQDVTAAQGLTRVVQVLSGNFGDLDNDGYLDFYVGRGYPGYEALIPNLMYRNRREKGFADVTTAGGFGHLQKGHGIAFADVDSDGDQDVFLQVGGIFPGDAFGDALFENPGADGNWFKVRLVGVRSNRSAIGARIRCEIGEGCHRRSVYRYVGSGGSFGANPLQQMVGVG